MSAHISCYNMDEELEHFQVPYPVYLYIMQLECEIKYGVGAVQKLYPGRFNGKFFEENE
mgnify:CR=1 FL=1